MSVNVTLKHVRWKTIVIKLYESVFVALVIQHAKRMRRIIFAVSSFFFQNIIWARIQKAKSPRAGVKACVCIEQALEMVSQFSGTSGVVFYRAGECT